MHSKDDEMISISHWGMHERKPIVIERKPNPFERCFPYPTLENKPQYRGWFLDILA